MIDLKIEKKMLSKKMHTSSLKNLNFDILKYSIELNNLSPINEPKSIINNINGNNMPCLLPILPKICKHNNSFEDKLDNKNKAEYKSNNKSPGKKDRNYSMSNIPNHYIKKQSINQLNYLFDNDNDKSQNHNLSKENLLIKLNPREKRKVSREENNQNGYQFHHDYMKTKLPAMIQGRDFLEYTTAGNHLNKEIYCKPFELKNDDEKIKRMNYLAIKHFNNFKSLVKRRNHILPESINHKPNGYIPKRKDSLNDINQKSLHNLNEINDMSHNHKGLLSLSQSLKK